MGERVVGWTLVAVGAVLALGGLGAGAEPAAFVGVGALAALLGGLLLLPRAEAKEPNEPFWPSHPQAVRGLLGLAVTAALVVAIEPVRHALGCWGVTSSSAQIVLAVLILWGPYALLERFIIAPLMRRVERREGGPPGDGGAVAAGGEQVSAGPVGP